MLHDHVPCKGLPKAVRGDIPCVKISGVERYNKRWISILTDPELAQILSGRAAVQLKVSSSSEPASCSCLFTGILQDSFARKICEHAACRVRSADSFCQLHVHRACPPQDKPRCTSSPARGRCLVQQVCQL